MSKIADGNEELADDDEINYMYTEHDIGDIVSYSNRSGSFQEEKIVLVYCQVCGARFIGPIRYAGGFLGGHEVFHTWEFKIEMNEELEV
tara:strand:- start:290 stop:556 length:267 start_codon:yes stop_codon:yes gene_type:complete